MDARETLISELREHALIIGEVTLTSGAVAQYYVDSKRAIMLPTGFRALGELVAAKAAETGATAVGGMTMGVASSLLINAADQEHRTRLLATVISAFSLVSIIGMPGMLFLCERFGWQTVPALIGVLCLLALIMIYVGLPKASGGAGSGTKIRITPTMLLFASGNALT